MIFGLGGSRQRQLGCRHRNGCGSLTRTATTGTRHRYSVTATQPWPLLQCDGGLLVPPIQSTRGEWRRMPPCASQRHPLPETFADRYAPARLKRPEICDRVVVLRITVRPATIQRRFCLPYTLVGRLGFEPRTLGLKVRCSDQTELPAQAWTGLFGAVAALILPTGERPAQGRSSSGCSHARGVPGPRGRARPPPGAGWRGCGAGRGTGRRAAPSTCQLRAPRLRM